MRDDDDRWPPPARPAVVYRLYDAAGVLLYVGISDDPERRMTDHRDNFPWWGDVAREKTTRVWFKSKEHARSAEGRAIATEHPVHNVQPGREIPHFGGPDAILTEEAAQHARLIWSIRDMYTPGASVEPIRLLFGQAMIDQALGDVP
jgi:hypothetical protein